MNTDKIYAEAIANEYSIKNSSKVVALKKLDKKAKQPSLIFAYTFGIISSLILGIGMSLTMSDFKEVLGSNINLAMPLGIVLGLIGILCCSINYPIYRKIRQAGMDKYKDDIILLAEEVIEKSKYN